MLVSYTLILYNDKNINLEIQRDFIYIIGNFFSTSTLLSVFGEINFENLTIVVIVHIVAKFNFLVWTSASF